MQDIIQQQGDQGLAATRSREAGKAASHGTCPACSQPLGTDSHDLPPLWPRLLGGEYAPALFRSNAFCATCARLGDDSIDNNFLKNWSMQGQQVRSALSFLDRDKPLPGPLTYLGIAADYQSDDDTFCERWAGLAGEQIFHIHRNREVAWAGRVGAEASPGAIDAGSVTLRLADSSAYWSQVANLSVAAYFPHARRFIINPHHHGTSAQPGAIAFDALFAPRQQEWFRAAHHGRLTLHPDLAQRGPQRFLNKLALSLGRRLFGPSFIRTSQARQLRRNFWSASPQVHSGQLAEGLERASAAFGCPPGRLGVCGAWTLILGPLGQEYGLCLITPAGQAMYVVIADDPGEAAHGHAVAACVAVPNRQIFLGPLPLQKLARHQAGLESAPELARLDAMRLAPSQLPPRRGLM
ncbi:MAG: hypothetical protein KGQ37_02245 [Hyphomicrobiales bacterium]|nr:hypothetical protein [Hyphomicrobiales bacterium]